MNGIPVEMIAGMRNIDTEIKKELSSLKRQKTHLKIQLDALKEDHDESKKTFKHDYDCLREFFPNANFNELENELLPCLLEMREQGVKIDMQGAMELDAKYTLDLEELQNELDTLADRHIDVNIDDDLIYLCDRFELQYAKTPKGNPCFSVEKIPKHRCFELVLSIRKMNKARDTYCRGYFFGSSFKHTDVNLRFP